MTDETGEPSVERPSSEQRRQHERRRLWDRRSADQRRASAAPGKPHSERRSQDRRLTALRRRGRRRRETPTPFSADQVAELKTRFAAAGPVRCPACGGAFSLGPGRRRGAETARRVLCLACGRAAVIPNARVSRILLVGEHAERRDGLQALLVSAGHEVIETADAGVALLAYQAVPADVIFLDTLAPGRMSAPEFLRRLRRVFPDARVVALAGRQSFTGVDPLAVTHGLGAVRTMRMPVSREELLRTIEEVRP
jgi:CheY-like chemotaxis protein